MRTFHKISCSAQKTSDVRNMCLDLRYSDSLVLIHVQHEGLVGTIGGAGRGDRCSQRGASLPREMSVIVRVKHRRRLAKEMCEANSANSKCVR